MRLLQIWGCKNFIWIQGCSWKKNGSHHLKECNYQTIFLIICFLLCNSLTSLPCSAPFGPLPFWKRFHRSDFYTKTIQLEKDASFSFNMTDFAILLQKFVSQPCSFCLSSDENSISASFAILAFSWVNQNLLGSQLRVWKPDAGRNGGSVGQ